MSCWHLLWLVFSEHCLGMIINCIFGTGSIGDDPQKLLGLLLEATPNHNGWDFWLNESRYRIKVFPNFVIPSIMKVVVITLFTCFFVIWWFGIYFVHFFQLVTLVQTDQSLNIADIEVIINLLITLYMYPELQKSSIHKAVARLVSSVFLSGE